MQKLPFKAYYSYTIHWDHVVIPTKTEMATDKLVSLNDDWTLVRYIDLFSYGWNNKLTNSCKNKS